MRRSPARKEMSSGRGGEVAALLEAARAVLENRAFADAARAILVACRRTLGAETAILAVYTGDEGDLKIVAVESGGLQVDGSAGSPKSLRRLSTRAFRLGRAAFANEASRPTSRKRAGDPGFTPANALVAPIIIAGDVAGAISLMNKAGGFAAGDTQLADVFAEMAAVAMLNSRTVNGLEKSRTDLEKEVNRSAIQLRHAEAKFKTLAENVPDLVARFDPQLRHLYVSAAVQSVAGIPSPDYVGKTNRELNMPIEFADAWDAALLRVFATGRPEAIELALPTADGARHFDCRILPELRSGGAVNSVLSVSRDVTELRRAYAAEQRAGDVADALREATVALTRSLDRETVLETLLDRLRRIVPFDRASVMLLDEPSKVSVRAIFDGDRVVPLPSAGRLEFDASDHPIVHDILTTGTAVTIPDVRVHPDWSLPTDRLHEASWMGVPLFARGNVAGLFTLSKREPGYFNEEHVRLAEAMSSQASVAVENAVLFEQMQASTERMQALSRRLVDVQESERRHIARELHDEAGQALVSLRYGLRLLEREVDEGGSVTDRVAELVERTDAVIDSLHRLSADLRPVSLDHVGLEAALRQYARSTESKFGITVRFKARGFTSERLPTAVETALYRVVQEAMTNILRHAHATQVDVLAECRGDRVLVMVEDDGVGFDPDKVQRADHFGLLGLSERAEALGGTLTIESSPGAGTTVVIEVASADPHPDR